MGTSKKKTAKKTTPAAARGPAVRVLPIDERTGRPYEIRQTRYHGQTKAVRVLLGKP